MNQKRPFSIFSLGFVSLLAFILVFSACKNDPINNNIPPEDNQTPVVSDYTIDGLTHIHDGSPKTVTITPKEGKSTGGRTIFYNGAPAAPIEVGEYTVTFNVAAVPGWNAAVGISAGTLIIIRSISGYQMPVAGDFTIDGLTQTYDGSPKTVTVTPKENKSTGKITVLYNASPNAPSNAGTYTVTFDVAEAPNWYPVNGLQAGTLTINKQTPITGDFEFGNMIQTAGSVTAVTITRNTGKTDGQISAIRYNGNNSVPQTAGTYPVLFNVAGTENWNAANDLSAGTLIVIEYAQPARPTEVKYTVYSNGSYGNGFSPRTAAPANSQTPTVNANPNGARPDHTVALGINDDGWGRFVSIGANNSTVDWSTVDALSFWMKGDNILVNSIGLLDDATAGADPLNIEYKGENGNSGFTINNTWTRYVLPIPNNTAGGINTRTEVFKLYVDGGRDGKTIYVDDIQLISASKNFSIDIPGSVSMNANTTADVYSLLGIFKARYSVDGQNNILLFSNLVRFGNWFNDYGFNANNNGASNNGTNVTAGSSNFNLTVTFGGVTSNAMAVTVSGGGGEPNPDNPVNPPGGDPAANIPYDSTIPQRPGSGVDKKMYFQFNNRTSGQYSDNQIYITIIGKDLNDPTRQWKYVNSSGNFANVKGTNLDGDPFPAGPKHTTAMAFRMSDGANSSAGTKYVYMPNIESGRMFISYGQPLSIGWVYGADHLLGFAGPDVNNTGDPNYNIHFEFLEFTIEPTPGELGAGVENRYHGNTTRVDFFDFPMVTTLHSRRGAYTVGEIGGRDFIRNAWNNEAPAAFKPSMNTMRIMAPAKGQNRVSNTYFDAYVNELWTTWRNAGANSVVFNCGDAGIIRGTMGNDNILRMVRDGHNGDANWGNIIIRKPTTDDVFEGSGALAYAEGSVTGSLAIQAQLCAAINRGVAHLPQWNNESQFYNYWDTNGNKAVNHYAKFWHQHSIGRHAYGFCYDDVFDWATLLVGENPIALVMDLKWN